MSMSRRELNMAGFMLAALLILFAYLFTRSKLDGIRANREGIATQQTLSQMRQNRIDKKAQVSLDLERLVGQLPVYPMGKNVASELYGQIESMAKKTGLNLSKIEVKEDEEEMTDGVYQMKIGGTYDAPSAAVVQFLYLTQSKGGALDVSLYSHKPKLREPGVVEGMFVMDCAYRRKDLSKLPPAAPAGGPVRAAPPARTTPATSVTPPSPTMKSAKPAPGSTTVTAPRTTPRTIPGTPPKPIDRTGKSGAASTQPPAGIPPPSGSPVIIRRKSGQELNPLATPQTPPGLKRPTIQPTRVGTGTIVPAGTTAPPGSIVPSSRNAPAGSSTPAGSGRTGNTPVNMLKTNPLRPPSLPGARANPNTRFVPGSAPPGSAAPPGVPPPSAAPATP